MKKRWRTVIWLGIPILLVAVGWLALRPQEPEFEGKRLSAWLAEIGPYYPADEAHSEVSNAIRTIGTAAIPFLLKDLQAQPNPWERLPAWIVERFPDSLSLPTAGARAERALAGFRELGSIGTPAIPELDRLVSKQGGASAGYAIYALRWIGTDEVMPVLLKHLASKNTDQRIAVIGVLADLGERAGAALPAIRTNLYSPDSAVRECAIRAIPRVAPALDADVVNELISLLKDSDRYVVRAALDSVSRYARDAASAAPELMNLIEQTPDPAVRFYARRVWHLMQCDYHLGGIIRGPKNARQLALVFTAHEFAEGGEIILAELARRHARGSFFLTGDFLVNTNFTTLISNLTRSRNYVGPHSDKHLLYCGWEASRPVLVSKAQFDRDLRDNLSRLQLQFPASGIAPLPVEITAFAHRYGSGVFNQPRVPVSYFVPPYEHYNPEIVRWTAGHGLTLINFTPGTRSNADYTGEADTNFVSSQVIFDSILKREREDPHGLNGFILLFHLGSGPGRQDKFHTRFGELLDVLAAKGYQFVRVDELLEPPTEKEAK